MNAPLAFPNRGASGPQPRQAGREPPPGGPGLRLAPPEPPLTCQEDPSTARRAMLALTALLFAGLLLAAAVAICRTGEGNGLLGIGLGRIGHVLAEAGMPGSWLIAALEQLHFAAMCVWFAFTLWFGMVRRPRPLAREQLYFHRRQSGAVYLPGFTLGIAGLVLGSWLSQWGIAGNLAAALVEAGALTLGLSAAWSMLLPEARLSMSVILDREEGFGNRVLIGGGAYRRLGRRTVHHYQLLGADTVAFPGTETLAGCSGLKLVCEGAAGRDEINLRGIAARGEIDQLSDFLNTRFQRALHPLVFTFPGQRQAGRAQLIPNWRR